VPDPVALVTGGSRGIGRAICRALAAAHAVAVNYSTGEEDAKETVSLIQASGGEAIAVKANVADRGRVEALFDEVHEALGPVSVLVNNAGIRRDGLALRMTDDDWLDVIGVDLSGAFFCTRRALRTMIRAGSGRIVNVASVAGIQGNAGQANYCAAKAGLIGLTKAVAREVARKGVTVNAVAPGLVATELTTSLPPERFAAIVDGVPAGRTGTPEEVAALVSFLCSESAGYINGAVLVADGAMTA
jgi:3-oxoacyl-[acyl-carrier protein] reductase